MSNKHEEDGQDDEALTADEEPDPLVGQQIHHQLPHVTEDLEERVQVEQGPVSYTHLTLPTTPYV